MGLGKNDLKFYFEGKRSEEQKQVGKVLVNMWDKLGLIRSNGQKQLGEEETAAVKKSDMLKEPAIANLNCYFSTLTCIAQT